MSHCVSDPTELILGWTEDEGLGQIALLGQGVRRAPDYILEGTWSLTFLLNKLRLFCYRFATAL